MFLKLFCVLCARNMCLVWAKLALKWRPVPIWRANINQRGLWVCHVLGAGSVRKSSCLQPNCNFGWRHYSSTFLKLIFCTCFTHTQSVYCFRYWVSMYWRRFDVRVVLTRGSFRLNYCDLPNVGLVPLVGVWRTRHTPRQTLHNPTAITGATHTHAIVSLTSCDRDLSIKLFHPITPKYLLLQLYDCVGWAVIRCCVYVAEIWVTTKSSWLAPAVWKVCRYCEMCKSIARRQFSQFCQSISRQQNTAAALLIAQNIQSRVVLCVCCCTYVMWISRQVPSFNNEKYWIVYRQKLFKCFVHV